MRMFYILTALFISSCDFSKPSTKAGFTFSISGNAVSQSYPEGLVVYGFNRSGQEHFSIAVQEEDVSLDLPNGKWDFFAIGWNSFKKHPSCGYSSSQLDGIETKVVLELYQKTCLKEVFTAQRAKKQDEVKPLVVESFYKIELLTKGNEPILSECLNKGSQIFLPTGSSYLPVGLKLHLFENNECESKVNSYTYPAGLLQTGGPFDFSGEYIKFKLGEDYSENESPCPSGFILVPGNESLETDDFCVMEKEYGDPSPATSVTARGAFDKCRESGYSLISNKEWMTIARNIESQDVNWTGGAVGLGKLKQGLYGNILPIDYIRMERFHQLSNGNIIWDLASNVAEWVDWSRNDGYLTPPPQCSGNSQWIEFNMFHCSGWNNEDYKPQGNYGWSQGMGKVYVSSGEYLVRGGSFQMHDEVRGIYTMRFMEATHSNITTGFRCVTEPNTDRE